MAKQTLKNKSIMLKLFKIISVIVLIPILIAVIIIATVNPNKYKNQLVNLVSSYIKREVTIGGDLNWSIFPLGITVKTFKVANDSKFRSESEYLVTSDSATVSLKLMPLLSQNFIIDSIEINNAKIYLEENSAGNTNWQSITQNDSDINNADNAKNKLTKRNKRSDDNTPIFSLPPNITDFSIKKVKITNSEIYWKKPNDSIVFKDLNLYGNNIAFSDDSSFDFSGSFNMLFPQKQMTAHISFDSEIIASNNAKTFTVESSSISAELGGKSYPRNPKFKLTSQLVLDLAQNSFKIKKIDGNLNHLLITGNLRGNFNDKTPNIDGKMTIAKSDLDDFLHDINFDTPKKSYKNISGDFSISTNRNIILLDPLKINFDEDSLYGFIKIDTGKKPYYINSKLNADTFNLDNLLITKSKTIQTNTLIKSAMSSIGIKNNEPPASTNNQSSPLFTNEMKETLANINIKHASKIKTLNLGGNTLNSLNLDTLINNGSIINVATFKAYDGEVKVESNLNTTAAVPTVQGNINVSAMKIESLIKEKFSPKKAALISGATNVTFKYNTSGHNTDQMLRGLNGNLKVKINDGFIHGIDLNNVMTLVNSKLDLGPEKILEITQSIMNIWRTSSGQKSISYVGLDQKTKVLSLSANAVINNGVLSNNDLNIDTPLIVMSGNGKINLINKSIDYSIKLNSKTAKNNNLEIPIDITGSLYNPAYNVDSVALLHSKIFNTLIKKNLHKIEETIKKIPGLKKLPFKEIQDALGL